MYAFYGKSHIGRRHGNEDRFVADAQWGLAMVADGMGGPAAGEVAASIATTRVTDQLDTGVGLVDAIVQANDDIMRAASEGRGKTGMGTTVVAAHFNNSNFELAWVGDSRAYLWNGELRLLTRDHSKVEGMLASGQLSFQDAARHPERHLITRALGKAPMEWGDISVIRDRLCRGEMLLLCSDGLHDCLSGCDIARLINGNDAPQSLIKSLIEDALAAGGSDNITVVLVVADDRAPHREYMPLLPAVSIFRVDGSHQYFRPQAGGNEGHSTK